MQFLPELRGSGEETRFVLTHRDEELTWLRKPFKTLKMSPEIIADINLYWSKQMMEKQDQIWALYKEIDQILFEVSNPTRLNDILKDKVKELFDLHPFEDVLKYMRRYSQVELPQGLKESEADMNERDTHPITYFRKDYENLAAWMIQMRIFLPVMTGYLNSLSGTYDTETQGYMAVKLIQRSEVVNSEPYLRLKEYCEHFWRGNTKAMAGSALLAGLSSLEVPLWLVGYVIGKLVIPGQISQMNTDAPVRDSVVSIFHQVKTLSDDLSKHFSDRITEKRMPQAAGNEEDRTSVAENYKTKQEVNEGDLLSHEFQSHQGALVGEMLFAEFDKALYQENLDNLKTFELDVNPFQRTICQWVLSPVVSPKSLFYIDYPGMENYIATAQTLLMQWGFDDIAQLLSGRIFRSTIALFASQRTEISNEQFAKLDVYYPFFIPQTRKKFNTKKRRNAAAADIDELATKYATTHWELALPETLSVRLESERDVQIPFPSNLEYELANLLIFLYERQLKQQ